MKLTIEIETDDLNILKLIAKAAYVKPGRSNDRQSNVDKLRGQYLMNDPQGASLVRAVSQLRKPASQK